jgi:molybdate transport system substrate-binding protein
MHETTETPSGHAPAGGPPAAAASRTPLSINGLFAMTTALHASTSAGAAEIRILIGGGVQEVMRELGPKFERATGYQLVTRVSTAGEIVKRVQAGETADAIIITRAVIDGFVADGKADAGNVADLAAEQISVAVRRGTPRPDISTPAALRSVLLAARSVACADPAGGGVGGIYFVAVLDRLGIADDLAAKLVLVADGSIGPALEQGAAEIGVQGIQWLLPFAGVDIVGPIPEQLQPAIMFSAVVMNDASDVAAARTLLSFLRTSEAKAAFKAKGMHPP